MTDLSFKALVYEIVIASPSDLQKDRKAVKEAILQWNSNHSKDYNIVFHPVMWETDTIPEMNIRPQESINKQII